MPKRKSEPTAVEPSTTPAAKKARKSVSAPSIEDLLLLSREHLNDLATEELVSHFTTLQNAYRELEKKQSTALMTVSANTVKPVDDPVKIREKANKIADMMADGIKKQMKWQ